VSGIGRIIDGSKYIQDAMYFYGKWQGSRENKEWAKDKEKKKRKGVKMLKNPKKKNISL